MWRLRLPRTILFGVLFAFLLAGCGGRGPSLTAPAAPSGSGGSTITSEPGTARFHVDVATGQVSITPMGDAARSAGGRAVFTGSAVDFISSTLVDSPSDAGIKVLKVQVVNRWGADIGKSPGGTIAGLRLLFSDITPVTSWSGPQAGTTVSTLAGSGAAGAADGAAAAASFCSPYGVAAGDDGAVFVADLGNQRIRKIAGGFVSTLAGSGAQGAQDGVGAAASFSYPQGIAINPVDGALIVTDTVGNRVRRVDRTGRVTTVAGTGTTGSADGSGTAATFSGPAGVTVDSAGTIFLTEGAGNRVRKIVKSGADACAASNYTVSTLAGSTSGASGWADAAGTAARFNWPVGITAAPDGCLYVADRYGFRIRRITPQGDVTTIAGTGAKGSADGTGDTATFSAPYGIVWTHGGLVVSDWELHTLRVLWPEAGASPASASSWVVRTLAGSPGTAGSVDGTGADARFKSPLLLAASPAGTVYTADSEDNKIRAVTLPNGFFTSGTSGGNTSTNSVRLSNADGIVPKYDAYQPFLKYDEALAPGGTSAPKEWWFVVPQGVSAFEFTVTVEANTAGLVPPDAATNAGSPKVVVRTLAGSVEYPNGGGFADGVGPQARFHGARALAADAAGDLFVADTGNHAIRRVTPDGRVSTVAGRLDGGVGCVDGAGPASRFYQPTGIAATPDGTALFVADCNNQVIRRIALTPGSDPADAANWTVSTIAGEVGTAGYAERPGDYAKFNKPQCVCLAPTGILYVGEADGKRVRRLQLAGGDPAVAANWQVALVAGDNSTVTPDTGTADGRGANARFGQVSGLAIDETGNLYVADLDNHRIRMVTGPNNDAGAVVTTLAGGGAPGGPQDGTGAEASFLFSIGVATDAAGFAYVCEELGRIRRVSPAGVVETVAGGLTGVQDGPGNTAQFCFPLGIAADPAGNLYVTDREGTCIRVIQRMVSRQ